MSETDHTQESPSTLDLSAAEFKALFDSVSNWQRWGESDQRGTLNLLTPENVAAAAGLVRTGETVTLSLPLNTRLGIDNPEPAVHRMTMLGDVDIGSGTLRFAKDFIGVDYHNESHSHIDALCHVAVDGVLYLSAVFLISDARRAGDPELERYFATRALAAALTTGAIALAGIFVLRSDARFLYDGLTDEGVPLVALSAVCGLTALGLIWRGARRGIRPLAVGAVVAVIWGWGVAQYPYLLPETLTIDAGAGTSETLTMVLGVFGVAVVLVLPAIGFLFTLSQRSVLEGEAPISPAGGAAGERRTRLD